MQFCSVVKASPIQPSVYYDKQMVGVLKQKDPCIVQISWPNTVGNSAINGCGECYLCYKGGGMYQGSSHLVKITGEWRQRLAARSTMYLGTATTVMMHISKSRDSYNMNTISVCA